MSYPLGAIQLTGAIGTTSSTDTYPTFYNYLGYGGAMQVADITSLHNIPSQRRTFGMTVTVQSDSVTSNNITWVLADSAHGGVDNNVANNSNWIAYGTSNYLSSAAFTTTLTGDVTGSGQGTIATSISSNAITTSKIINSAVTYGKIQNVSANSLLGNSTGASAVINEIGLGNTLTFSSNSLTTVAITGDVTSSSNSFSTTVLWGNGYTTYDARYAKLSGATFTGAVILNSDPTTNLQAATKQYVDNAAGGIIIQNPSAVAATTTNITISSAPSTIDGVTPSNGATILVKNQTNAAENGVYIYNGAGSALTRSPNMNTWSQVPHAAIFVSGGTTNAYTTWLTNVSNSGTIDITPINWGQLSASPSYTAGSGLTLSGSQFSVTTNGITNSLFRQSSANTIVGNPTGTTANVTDISLGNTLTFSGSTIQTVALSGDVTTSANSFSTTISNNAVITSKIADSNVTYSKIQNVNSQVLLGRYAATSGVVQEITLGSGISLNSSTGILSATGSGGTVTSIATTGGISGGTITTSGTLSLSAISAYSVLGNNTSSTGTPSAAISYSSSPLANTISYRDSNANAFANNFSSNFSSTTGSAGVTILSASSARIQNLVGISSQTFQLPDATTLTKGFVFEFNNNSSGTLNVVDNGSNIVTSLPRGGYAFVLLTDNSTTNGSWDKHFLMPANASYGTNGMAVNGTISATSSITAGANGFVTTGTTSGSVIIKSITGSWTFTLPSNAGTSGYFLQTDGSGNSSWQPAITLTTTGSSGSATYSGGTLNIPTYTLSGLGGQPLSTNLTSIASLANGAGVLYNNGTGTFSYTTTPTLTGTNFSGTASSLTAGNTTGINGASVPTTSTILGSNSSGQLISQSASTVQSFLGLGSNAYTSTAYLPLTGGTLTGPLSGTSATFNAALYNSQVLYVNNTNNDALSDGLVVNIARTSSDSKILRLQSGGVDKVYFDGTGALTGTSATFSNTLIVNANIATKGSSAGYEIYRRDNSAYAGTWYSSAGDLTLDLYNVGAALNFTANTGGATLISTLTTGNDIYVRKNSAQYANIIMTDNTLGSSYGGQIRGYGVAGRGGWLGLGTYSNGVYTEDITISEANTGITINPPTTFNSSVTASSFSGAGTGLTGTASSLTAGNATTWSGNSYIGARSMTSSDFFLTNQTGTANWGYTSVSSVQAALGLGSNAYTSTAYLPLTGGTVTGATSFTNGNLVVSNSGASASVLSTGNGSIFWSQGIDADNNWKLKQVSYGYTPIIVSSGSDQTVTLAGALSGTSATFSSSVTASSFIKSGGTSSQFLAADGSVIIAGSGLSLSGGVLTASGAVSSVNAGTDISVSATTGAVTVNNTSTLSSVTGRGASTASAISITNSTASTSTTTGALIVTGGVGVGGAMYVGSSVTATGFFESSDFRLKNVLNSYKSNSFGIVDFTWKDKRDDYTHVGYLAQEVKEYLPSAVSVSANGMLTVNYQEAHSFKIRELELKIIQLENQIKEYKK